MTQFRIAPPDLPHIPASEITPKEVFLNRRQWLAGAGALTTAAGLLPQPAEAAQVIVPLAAKANPQFKPSDAPTDKKLATTYNNYYEFGTSKSAPANEAASLTVRPWSIEVTGEVAKPRRIDLEDQGIGRVTVVMQHILIGLTQGVGQHFIAHETAVDEEILCLATAAHGGRQRAQASQRNTPGTFVHAHRGGGKILAEDGADAAGVILCLELPLRACIVLQAETDVVPRQCDAAEYLVAMGIFGGVRAQEFASCWRIEKKFLRFDAGTGFLSGWLRLRDAAVFNR